MTYPVFVPEPPHVVYVAQAWETPPPPPFGVLVNSETTFTTGNPRSQPVQPLVFGEEHLPQASETAAETLLHLESPEHTKPRSQAFTVVPEFDPLALEQIVEQALEQSSLKQARESESSNLDNLNPEPLISGHRSTLAQNATESEPGDLQPSTRAQQTPVGTPVPENHSPELSTQEPRDLQADPLEAPDANLPLESDEAASRAADGDGQSFARFGILQLVADRQDYDQRRQLIIAQGNVFLRFQQGQLQADAMTFNLNTQVLLAEGNVRFIRGKQRLEGETLEYNLVQEMGQIEPASGEILTTFSSEDLDFEQAPSVPLNQIDLSPVSQVNRQSAIIISSGFGTSFGSQANEAETANPGEVEVPIQVSSFRQEGTIKHWRFQAEQLEILPDGWNAYNVRMTNDPFSPPQFEVRAQEARYRELSPLVSELRADRPRYVFEDVFPFPTFRNRVLFDRRPQDSGLITLGFDDDDRGGLFIERSFEPISTDNFRLGFTPQLLIQKALSEEGGNLTSPNSYAFQLGLEATPTSSTTLTGSLIATDLGAAFNSLTSSDEEEEDLDDTLRGSLRAEQLLPWDHRLNLETSFRDRLFNGSLGFQTVQRTVGGLLLSPIWSLGNTGITAEYQLGVQSINADTDFADLLDADRANNRVTLTRYQASARLNRGFVLWHGEPLEATPDAGLRYTAVPVTPSISLGLSAIGIYSLYSSGDVQEALTGQASVTGVFGHFSRPWFDYTRINVSYSQALRGNESPFTFDRINDTQVFSFGITQQLFGPVRFGFETSLALDTDEQISVDYRLEYSRRAFDVGLRFNPELEVGSLTFRFNDFAWQGRPADF